MSWRYPRSSRARTSCALKLAATDISGFGATDYVIGACCGALFFGWLTDRLGRKRLFMVTLGVYLLGTAMTGLAFAPWWFFVFCFVTGQGIGGEYASINSAIDELIPSSHRGRVDVSVNGTYRGAGRAGDRRPARRPPAPQSPSPRSPFGPIARCRYPRSSGCSSSATRDAPSSASRCSSAMSFLQRDHVRLRDDPDQAVRGRL